MTDRTNRPVITLTRGELTERMMLRLTTEDVAQLRAASQETGVTVSSILRVGIGLAIEELRANPPRGGVADRRAHRERGGPGPRRKSTGGR